MLEPVPETLPRRYLQPAVAPARLIALALLVSAVLSLVACSGSGKVQPAKKAETRLDRRNTTLANALKNDEMQLEIDHANLQGGAASDARLPIDQFLVDADRKAQLIANRIESYGPATSAANGDPMQSLVISRADQTLDGFVDACRMWAKDAKTLQQAKDGCTGLTKLADEVLSPPAGQP